MQSSRLGKQGQQEKCPTASASWAHDNIRGVGHDVLIKRSSISHVMIRMNVLQIGGRTAEMRSCFAPLPFQGCLRRCWEVCVS